MSKLKLVFVFCVAVCFAVVMRAQGPAPELPAAPITPKVKTACLECHDSGIIVQQRLDKKLWGKEVDKMIKWGALVDAADRDAFIDYFVANFGADKPPAAPEYTRTSLTKEKPAKPPKRQ
jgi:hypothetical protein